MPRRFGSRLARFLLVLLASYYLYRAVRFRFLTPDQLGPDLLHKQLWYVGHLLAALAVFVGGPPSTGSSAGSTSAARRSPR